MSSECPALTQGPGSPSMAPCTPAAAGNRRPPSRSLSPSEPSCTLPAFAVFSECPSPGPGTNWWQSGESLLEAGAGPWGPERPHALQASAICAGSCGEPPAGQVPSPGGLLHISPPLVLQDARGSGTKFLRQMLQGGGVRGGGGGEEESLLILLWGLWSKGNGRRDKVTANRTII